MINVHMPILKNPAPQLHCVSALPDKHCAVGLNICISCIFYNKVL